MRWWHLRAETNASKQYRHEERHRIMAEWKEYKLGEISNIQTGPFGSQLHKSEYVEEGIPCIMPTNIGQQLNIDESNIAHIDEINANRLNRHLVKEGDIIYARRGDIEKFMTGAKGTKMPRGDKRQIMNYRLLIPSHSIIDKFNNFVLLLLSKIDNNQNESHRLSQLRDTLLPKLMSGEIDL